jgi:hypothetical protein
MVLADSGGTYPLIPGALLNAGFLILYLARWNEMRGQGTGIKLLTANLVFADTLFSAEQSIQVVNWEGCH